MTAPYILYGGGVTCGISVLVGHEESQSPYELTAVDNKKGERLTPEP